MQRVTQAGKVPALRRIRMASSRRHFLAVLWSTLYEPRSVTIAMLAIYAVSIVAAVMLWVAPPEPNPPALRVVATVLLAAGGLTGAPAAWRGMWWMERVSALATVTGIALVGILATAAHLAVDGSAWVTVYGLAIGALALLARFARVRRAPFAPGKGPETTAQRTAALRDRLEEDTGGHAAVPDDDGGR